MQARSPQAKLRDLSLSQFPNLRNVVESTLHIIRYTVGSQQVSAPSAGEAKDDVIGPKGLPAAVQTGLPPEVQLPL